MISISPISVADVESRFENIRKSGAIPGGWWAGNLSAHVRFQSHVSLQHLMSVFKGRTPDGKEQLFPEHLQQAQPEGGLIRATAPSTVRNLWTLSPKPTRLQIERSHEFGLAFCLDRLEQNLLRPGHGRLETLIPGVLMAVVPSDSFQQAVPQIQTEAFMPNLILPIEGPVQRCSFFADKLEGKSAAMTSLYHEVLCQTLHLTLGLEFVQASGREPEIVGVPKNLAFSESQAEKQPRGLSRLFLSHESLKFEDWRTQAKSQGWGKVEAEALLKYCAELKTAWSTFNKATREKLERMRNESEPSKTVTKPLSQTTKMTHSH